MNPTAVKGKTIDGATSIIPQYHMLVELRRAAELIAHLQDYEGYRRTHRLKHPSKPRPVSDAKETTDDSGRIQSESDRNLNNENTWRKRNQKSQPHLNPTPKDLFKYLPGWHIEQCKRYKPHKTPGKVRNRANQGRNCPAKFAIKFQEGYHHKEDGSLNVEQFGDMLVMLHWSYKHNHTDFDIGRRQNMRELKKALDLA